MIALVVFLGLMIIYSSARYLEKSHKFRESMRVDIHTENEEPAKQRITVNPEKI